MKYYMIIIFLLSISSVFCDNSINIIELADTLKYNWNSPEERYSFRENHNFKKSLIEEYNLKKINIPNNMSRSMILPGWGHFQSKNYLRGQIILSSEIILASASIFMYNKAMDKYDLYNSSTQIDNINQYYSEANSAYKQASICGFMFVIVWIYNIYDTYKVSEQYNEQLWNDLILKEKNKKVIIHPHGFQIKF